MYISQNCFKDEYLRGFIRQYNILGKCDFSNLENTYVIDLEILFSKNKTEISEIFDLYVYEYEDYYKPKNEYEEDFVRRHTEFRDKAKISYNSLINLLQINWNLFDDNIISQDKVAEILLLWAKQVKPYINHKKEDFTDLYWYDKRYKYACYFVKDDWDYLNYNMQHNFRYNFKNIPNINYDINKLLSHEMFSKLVISVKKGKILYRGRIKEKNVTKYKRKEMLIPPLGKKSIGRANPIGINYLYTASTIKTAIAEVRAWKNCIVSIATLKLKTSINLIDLSIVDIPKSIFETLPYSEFNILNRMEYWELEELLQKTLAIPIDPRDAEVEYIFTQYICERVRALGYDGIVFKSSLGEGVNYVFFSDEYIIVETIDDYKVEDIEYKALPTINF